MLADILFMEDKQKRSALTQDIENRLTKMFNGMTDSNRKTFLIVAFATSLILAVLASLTILYKLPSFVSVLIGAPAGLVLSVLIYYFLEYKGHKLTEYKEKISQKQRVKHVLIGWAILVPVLIFSSQYLAAFGGVIIICAFIFTLVIIRRTDEENYYFTNGLIDPRELEDGSEASDFEDYDEDFNENEEDNK